MQVVPAQDEPALVDTNFDSRLLPVALVRSGSKPGSKANPSVGGHEIKGPHTVAPSPAVRSAGRGRAAANTWQFLSAHIFRKPYAAMGWQATHRSRSRPRYHTARVHSGQIGTYVLGMDCYLCVGKHKGTSALAAAFGAANSGSPAHSNSPVRHLRFRKEVDCIIEVL